MWKAVKPVVAPVLVLGTEYVAIQRGWLDDDLLVGIVFGLGLFWLIWAVLSHKELVRRAPWLCEWMPFLDPGGLALSARDLHSGTIVGKSFNLNEIAVGGKVFRRTIEDCVIHGPAIVIAERETIVRDCEWIFSNEHYWITAPNRPYAGTISLVDCTLIRCVLQNIGQVGPQDAKTEFDQHVGLASKSNRNEPPPPSSSVRGE